MNYIFITTEKNEIFTYLKIANIPNIILHYLEFAHKKHYLPSKFVDKLVLSIKPVGKNEVLAYNIPYLHYEHRTYTINTKVFFTGMMFCDGIKLYLANTTFTINQHKPNRYASLLEL